MHIRMLPIGMKVTLNQAAEYPANLQAVDVIATTE